MYPENTLSVIICSTWEEICNIAKYLDADGPTITRLTRGATVDDRQREGNRQGEVLRDSNEWTNKITTDGSQPG